MGKNNSIISIPQLGTLLGENIDSPSLGQNKSYPQLTAFYAILPWGQKYTVFLQENTFFNV